MTRDSIRTSPVQVFRAARGQLLLFTISVAAGCSGGSGAGGPHDSPVVVPCSHSPCHAGTGLDYMCDTCVQQICANPLYSGCCNVDAGADGGWTQLCVNAVTGAGGMVATCAQRCDCTQTGTPLEYPFNKYACDCTATECSSNPSCCTSTATTGWTMTCVNDINRYQAIRWGATYGLELKPHERLKAARKNVSSWPTSSLLSIPRITMAARIVSTVSGRRNHARSQGKRSLSFCPSTRPGVCKARSWPDDVAIDSQLQVVTDLSQNVDAI